MLVWPMVAALGFVALTGVVIALGTSSTARYDFERNRVEEPAVLGASAVVPRSGRATGRRAERREGVRAGTERTDGGPRAVRGRRAAERQAPSSRVAGGVATHPAGRRLVDGESRGWWLIDQPREGGVTGRVLAGPFPDRLEAEWAALAESPAGPVSERVVHGVRTAGGTVLPTPAPQESAWMLELGEQLTRLGEDWFELVSDTDPLTTLVVEVAEALVEAGLPLHDCSGPASGGGVCLTPCAEYGGILVTWQGHDRMTRQQLHGGEVDAALRRTMGTAVAELLVQRGFDVQSVGGGSGHLVRSARG